MKEMQDADESYDWSFPPNVTFGATIQQGDDLMDFTFDPITTPGGEDLLAAMQAIQSPKWLESLMPGSVDESGCRMRTV